MKGQAKNLLTPEPSLRSARPIGFSLSADMAGGPASRAPGMGTKRREDKKRAAGAALSGFSFCPA